MNISDAGLGLISEHEGCRLYAYQDSVGIWTIGYGHTRGVQRGDTCTQEQADEWLREDVHDAETCVEQSVTVPLSQGEFDALCSFVFNLGCVALRNSTLRAKLNAKDVAGAAAEFLRWNHAGGKVVAGLTARRQAEQELFLA